ncbi:MAG: type VI secretion system tip protein VgrG [Deltaproteobacteria bacterium]|nr:type VI secretion system tip protein VgrG [Deltaproteobacteria bacterium]
MSSPSDAHPLPTTPHGGVQARFECADAALSWHVRRAVVREGLSRAYAITLSLLTPELDADVDTMVGASAEFGFDRGSVWRTFHGVVSSVRHRGIEVLRGDLRMLAIDLELGPALATSAQRIDCRIFQDMTVPQIVRDLLMGLHAPTGAPAEGLAAHQRTLDDSGLVHDGQPPREYCVQYRESDLDFVRRLLHEEGIAFVFDQDGPHEVMRLVDSEGGLPQHAGTEGVRLPVVVGGEDAREAVRALVVERSGVATKATVAHHDWLLPAAPLRGSHAESPRGLVAENHREVYLPSERRSREVSSGGKVVLLHDDDTAQAQLVLERAQADDFVVRGRSTSSALGAGVVFEIEGLGTHERLVALEVVHEILADGDTVDVAATYDNAFVAVPSPRYRIFSPEPVRPRVYGPQTATVTGPEGEDIHTDAFGRIKILMHWDREGEGRGRSRRADASSSAWVPVVQSWAGAGWGALFLPRVGMEVIVEFLDGNPDRPVVSGCLYNGRNPPPYPLPDERTRSTIRSQSTPYNGGYNELRFEDSAGREELFLRAQLDMNELVLRHHGTEVKVDQTHRVGNDRTRKVGGDERISVHGSRTVVIDGASKSGFAGETIKVSDHWVLDVAKTILVRAPEEIRLECKGSSIVMTPERITLQAGGGAKIVLDANALVESKDGSRGFLDQNLEIRAAAGAIVMLDDKARATAKEKAELLLDANARLSSGDKAHALFEAEKITVDSGEASIVIDGKRIQADADELDAKAETKLALEGGGGRVSLAGGKAQVN